MMVSSVSVDDTVRKRIKKIAAELDTSQGEVVAMGIEILERQLQNIKPNDDHPGRKIIRKAIEGRQELDWRSEIRRKLSEPGVSIEEVLISSWSELGEN